MRSRRALNTLVVVNCAGRTRSIIGAQSLINANIGNEVVALRNGTMGWHLAGYELEHDQTRYVDDVGELNGEEAQHHAASVAERFGVRTIDHRTLNEWQRSDERSVFLLDVRSPKNFSPATCRVRFPHRAGNSCRPRIATLARYAPRWC